MRGEHHISRKASSFSNLFVLLINFMELARITVFLESERDSWPNKRILQRISSSVGYARSFFSRNLKTFWIRMPLGPLKLGQRNRKCSLVSFSRPHLQIGEEQLIFFLKRWSRRSLWPTRRQVRCFIPCRSEEIGKVFFLRSLVLRQFLNLIGSRSLISGSSNSYFKKQ